VSYTEAIAALIHKLTRARHLADSGMYDSALGQFERFDVMTEEAIKAIETARDNCTIAVASAEVSARIDAAAKGGVVIADYPADVQRAIDAAGA
jgi:hypothetical protein